MSSGPFLFVYGTLLSRAAPHPHRRALHTRAECVGRALLRGRLYRLKRYPALRAALEETDWVAGEVWRLRQAGRTLAELDAYEGPEYRRVRRRAVVEGGREVVCWVYEWRRPLARWRRLGEGAWHNGAACSSGASG